jgi:serine/threonine-protein kinase
MDYCEGGTLRQLMQADAPLSMAQSVRLIRDILSGLEHAHGKGIIHCDIKPENILLKVTPQGWTACISDFGIARLAQDASDAYGALGNTGSPAYMAPERFYGQHAAASDLYAVGVLLFELLAGDRPFSGTPMELMACHLSRPLGFPAAIAPAWRPVIQQAMQKLPARRFHTAQAMRQMIDAVAEETGLWASPQPLFLPQPVGGDRPNLDTPADMISSPLGSAQRCAAAQHATPLQPSEGLESVDANVTALAIAPLPVAELQSVDPSNASAYLRYCISGSQIRAQPFCHHEPVEAAQTLTLSAAPTTLQVRPQGCFAISSSTIDLLTYQPDTHQVITRPIARFQQKVIATIGRSGRWLAVGTAPSPMPSQLPARTASPTQSQSPQIPPQRHSNLLLLPLSQASKVSERPGKSIRLPERSLHALVSLDACHVLALSTQWGAEASILDIHTRRGTHLVSMVADVVVADCIAAPFPYTVLAIERGQPSLLLIDLKPYRLMRIGLSIVPKVLAAAPWGYVVADADGQVVLLDERGKISGQFDLGVVVGAIAPLAPHHLLVAIHNGFDSHGSGSGLHLLDLKQMGTSFIF